MLISGKFNTYLDRAPHPAPHLLRHYLRKFRLSPEVAETPNFIGFRGAGRAIVALINSKVRTKAPAGTRGETNQATSEK